MRIINLFARFNLKPELIGMLPPLVGQVFPLVQLVQLPWKARRQVVPAAVPFLEPLVRGSFKRIHICLDGKVITDRITFQGPSYTTHINRSSIFAGGDNAETSLVASYRCVIGFYGRARQYSIAVIDTIVRTIGLRVDFA